MNQALSIKESFWKQKVGSYWVYEGGSQDPIFLCYGLGTSDQISYQDYQDLGRGSYTPANI